MPSPTGLSCTSLQESPRSPGSRAWNFQTCMGSTTTQDRPTTRAHAAGRVAFRYLDSVGALISDFRSSIPSPSFPLFTLRWTFRNVQCKTRGRADCYSFLVRLFHPLFHAGLARRTQVFVPQEQLLIDEAPQRRRVGVSSGIDRTWQNVYLKRQPQPQHGGVF